MATVRLNGLIAATYTPFHGRGDLNPEVIPQIVKHLFSTGVSGLYVCGSTGEGISLSTDERKMVAESYVAAARSVDATRPVLIQVGHNSMTEARRLAAHAKQIGANAISATCPSYFKISDIPTLIECMGELASAVPELPFYYYHIPVLTGSTLDMVEFLNSVGDQIPNLVGIKYTDTKLFEFQKCLDVDGGKFDMVWGCDEMLLGAVTSGANAAIGSTYNIAAPLYLKILKSIKEGDLAQARKFQLLSIDMIRVMLQYPFHAAMKSVLKHLGFSVGQCRLPQGNLNDEQTANLIEQLKSIGFEEWSQPNNQS